MWHTPCCLGGNGKISQKERQCFTVSKGDNSWPHMLWLKVEKEKGALYESQEPNVRLPWLLLALTWTNVNATIIDFFVLYKNQNLKLVVGITCKAQARGCYQKKGTNWGSSQGGARILVMSTIWERPLLSILCNYLPLLNLYWQNKMFLLKNIRSLQCNQRRWCYSLKVLSKY